METSLLITELKRSVGEVADLKQIKEGFHNPRVKAWKTRLEEVLEEGGTTCAKALATVRQIKMTIGGNEFIKSQTFMNQLDALERTIRQTIQCIEVLGRPEDRKLPDWGKPKSQHLAKGHLMVGDKEIASNAITIHEVLDCLVSMAETSNDLSESMQADLLGHLGAILNDELLQPFLNQKLDKLLGHWPEFASKETS